MFQASFYRLTITTVDRSGYSASTIEIRNKSLRVPFSLRGLHGFLLDREGRA